MNSGVVRYEARPTKMFGAYTVVAVYGNGVSREVDHGDPRSCLARAAALNATVPTRAEPARAGGTAVFDSGNFSDWSRHLFGLPSSRWSDLSGRVVWIVGAGTGYGRALACALGAARATVVLTGRRPEKLAETAAAMTEFAPGSRGLPMPGDCTKPDDMARIAEAILAEAGRLDGLVCAAALPQANKGGLAVIQPAILQAMIGTNVLGQLHAARAAVPAMKAAGRYRIVFLTSEAGWASTPGFGPYNMTKAALNNLAASLAAELRDADPRADVQVNVVSPGEAQTEMNSGSRTDPLSLASIILLLLSHPAGGPNGRFFHRDGRHLQFAYSEPWPHPLTALQDDAAGIGSPREQRTLPKQLLDWFRR